MCKVICLRDAIYRERTREMNAKHAIVFSIAILMLGSFLVVPSTLSQQIIIPTDSYISSPEEQASQASVEGLEELKYNVNENPSFESADTEGWPAGYSGFATAFRTTDYAYTTDVNSGTYAGYIASHGVTKGGTSQAYFSRSIGQNPTALLSEGVSLDFYWNTLANPDIDTGSYVYVLVQTTNLTGFYHEIRYYLSNHYFSTSNTSTLTCYLWDYPTDAWYHFSRDLGSDYAANPLNSPADSTRRVMEIYWYAASTSQCANKLEFLLDDASLTNGTYSGWIQNGGFETGNGQFWGYSYSTPTFVSQTTDSTDGTYALNMTTGTVESGTAYGAVERDFTYPAGIYCNAPEETVVEFDWKFNSAPGITFQYGSFVVTFVNETGTYYIHLMIGFGVDTFTGYSNSSNSIYTALDGFNVRDAWHSAQLDMHDYISEFGSTVGAITEFQFYVYAPGATAKVSLLVDDFRVISSVTGDPSFELNWYSSSFTPFAAWFRGAGDSNTIQQTNDSFTGSYACNLTPYVTHTNPSVVIHPTFVDIGSNDFINFWWRLDSMNDVSNSRAYVGLTFESGKILYYFLGASASYTPTNTTTVGFINAQNFNVTGIWNNLNRNITQDAEQVFGAEDWQITTVAVYTDFYYNAIYDSRVSLIVDDIIITDGVPPVIESVDQLTTNPMYYDDVDIQIAVSDSRPGVSGVIVNYTIDGGSSWTSLSATGTFDVTIPAQLYGTLVEYYVIAIDEVGLIRIDDNDGTYYSYTVGDDINPTISIDSPIDMAEVEGLVSITATAGDDGSGINRVDFAIVGLGSYSDSAAPYSYDWQTDSAPLGMYTIEVQSFDEAGNSYMDTINVSIIDTIAPIISEPPDFEFVDGWISQNITWHVSDLRPDSFEVLVNGSPIHSGSWTLSSTTIEVTVDSIGQGVHNVTLIVIDAGGNSASDTVVVTVTPHYFTEEPTTNTTIPSETTSGNGGGDTAPLVIIAVIGVGGILIIAFVVLPVLKKR